MDAHTDATSRLRATRGFVLDMDGTLVLGDNRNKGLKPLPGALDLVRVLNERGVPFVLLTNGTTRTPEEYATTMRELGFGLRENSILTPASVAADYLARRRFRRVMVLGGEGIAQPLRAAGLTVSRPAQGTDVDAIFVGWYREFTMDDIEAASNAVFAGAKLFVASMSLFFATANGRALGTSRVIAAAIASATGARPKVLGKPALEALKSAGRRLHVPLADLTVVGDDPALEVPMAHRGGALAVAVHTGVGREADFAQMEDALRPHLSVAGADALLKLYEGR
jgi:NagD protein